MPQILFICTANYYRSRFCEHLFNHLAPQHHLDWTAISRGVATELGGGNVGPISPYTINGLKARGVPVPDSFRKPRQLTVKDLQTANSIIALDEVEHRSYMEMKFPAWVDKVTYWQVGDLHVTTTTEALAQAEQKIRDLIQQFSTPGAQQNGVPAAQFQNTEFAPATGPWEFCPRCSTRLVNRRCKFVCENCGYFMSCSDFD